MVSPVKFLSTLTFPGIRGKTLALLFSAVFMLAPPAQAALPDKSLQKTVAFLQQANDPLARKLVTWIYATETDMPIHALDLIAFARENPGWPRQHVLREKIEKNLDRSARPEAVAAWFAEHPPQTYEGVKTGIQALTRLDRADAKALLVNFWTKPPEDTLKKNHAAALAGAYPHLLTPPDHAARLDALLWQDRYAEAEFTLAFVPPDIRALGHARIALGRMSSQAEKTLHEVPPALQKDEGLLFERLRWRRRRNQDAGALELISLMPPNSAHAELWWGELNILARREIEKRNYAAAYNIAKNHALPVGSDFAQAEWLLGWLSLEFMRRPAEATAHFDRFYQSVQSAISRSRAAYWLARTMDAAGDKAKAAEWHAASATYLSTFYGQLSYQKIHSGAAPTVLSDPPLDPHAWVTFGQNELVRAARLLHQANMKEIIAPFLARLVADAATAQDYAMAARLAREVGHPYYAVQANKDAQQKLGIFLFTEGYPFLPFAAGPAPEKSLVHAIVYRESMFNSDAASSAGAQGLMQLMPATAKAVSRKLGETYTSSKLTKNPHYNVLLGSAYLQQLVNKYDGFYPLAIAAYNAGPYRVDSWIDEFGDPRKPNVDLVNWIEHIPIYETRNYVQRVMESYYMYRLRFSERPRTALDFARR